MKKRYVLTFAPEVVNTPLTYNLIKDYDIKVNILNAYISPGKQGKLAIEMESADENINRGLEYIRENGVKCVPLVKKIGFREELCVHCGSCTAVCFTGALTMDRQTWELHFDHEKCVICELCTFACPLKLFEIDFVE